MNGLEPGHLAPVLALVIDRVVGDPAWLWDRAPHPVVLMGRIIGRLDARLNDPALPFARRRMRGAAAMLLLVLVAGVVGAALHSLAATLRFGFALEAIAAATLFAQHSLVSHVRAVSDALARHGIAAARAAVGRIVGRDVSVLDEAGVARAAIESAAENFSDGLVAPVFWYALLGLPGLLAFKMASTADSMIGHRSARHEAFGWAAARLDDLLNIVPARLSAVLLAAAAAAIGANAGGALAAAGRDAPRHRSPNAGWPEAAAAGALGLKLGGPRRYGETTVEGAWLNGGGRAEATRADIAAVIRLVDAAWVLVLALLLVIGLAR